MDQSKWSIPRHRNSRMTKSECPLQRPRFKIEGVWMLGCYHFVFLSPLVSLCVFVRAWPKLRIHNVSLDLYVLDPRAPSDASTVLECCTQSLEHALQKIALKQKQQPDQLMIWVSWQNLWLTDNCFSCMVVSSLRTLAFQSCGSLGR